MFREEQQLQKVRLLLSEHWEKTLGVPPWSGRGWELLIAGRNHSGESDRVEQTGERHYEVQIRGKTVVIVNLYSA